MAPRARREIEIPPPGGLVAHRFEDTRDEFALLEWASPAGIGRAGLTRAESEVLTLLLAGLRNQEIARARGRATRTVANQVAAIFRKLSVGSRLELFALRARRLVPRPPA